MTEPDLQVLTKREFPIVFHSGEVSQSLCSIPESPCPSLALRQRYHENRRRHHSKLLSFSSDLSQWISVCVFQGFDEFMNLVMDDAVEVYMKKDFRRQIGWFEFKHLLQ